jgi:hypothetical protein
MEIRMTVVKPGIRMTYPIAAEIRTIVREDTTNTMTSQEVQGVQEHNKHSQYFLTNNFFS